MQPFMRACISYVANGLVGSFKSFVVSVAKSYLVALPLSSKGALTVYFDPQPKTKREDLFDREAELKQFSGALSYASLIVVTGLRRSGKTSFMNVALAESRHPYINLDLRGLPYNPSHMDIVRRLEAAFNRVDRKWFTSICDALKHVKGVSIVGNALSLDWSRTGVDLAGVFDKIDDWASKQKERFLVGFDEIQLIRGDKGIPRLFAHIADTDQNVILVITGSEVGLLFDFLGFEDTESPLYGRHYTEINMQNFDPVNSESFLRKGFQQISLKIDAGVLDYALQKLDGVVGWLTLFGARCRDGNKCTQDMVDEVMVEGGKLGRAEALKLVSRSKRYGVVLNFLAKVGTANWTQIKATLEAKENRLLPSPTVAGTLNTLIKTSLISKTDRQYSIIDPLLASGVQRDPLPE